MATHIVQVLMDPKPFSMFRVLCTAVLVLLVASITLVDCTPIMSYQSAPQHADSHDYKVVCYYGSWAVYRPGGGKFPVEAIDPHLCSHLVYGFAGLGHDNRIRSLDSWNDLADNYGKGAFKRFTGLKKQNPKLKTIIAIGGWNEGSIKYSNMAENPASRKTFVDSVVEFCKKYDFDGLDMDWEYPGSRGGKPEDKQNFVALLRELSEAFRPHGLLLTAAVSAGKHFMDPAYDIPQVSKYLDLIHVMAYDFHGGWETITGHHAPMFSRPEEPLDERILNLNFSVNYWIDKGAPRNKIILGLGLYGRSFTLARSENHNPRDSAPQKGRAGPYTREKGSLGYNEICENLEREKWTVVRDPFYMAPYAFRERQWVGYDDMDSIAVKVNFAKAMGLGGGMVWSIETDDFHGKCHGLRYPLLSTINKVFASGGTGSIPVPPPTSAPPPPTPSTEKTWWPRPTTPSSQQPSSSQTPSSTMYPPPPSTPKKPTWQPSSTTTQATTSTQKTWPQPSSTTMAPPSQTPSTEKTWWPRPSTKATTPTPSTQKTWWPRPSTESSTTPSTQKTWWPRPSSTVSSTVPSTQKTWWTRPSSTMSSTVPSTQKPWWTKPSSTTTTTTTSKPFPEEPPNVPPESGFKCTTHGTFSHPNDCQKFYDCVYQGGQEITAYEKSCPDGTVFNPNNRLCTWPVDVPQCKDYFLRKYAFLRKYYEG
ncbi:chitotriosidase-1-like [Ornithodoros turicata]|uniref:chitotriosidase-1-like n=1 Tax=Ornithodoros turicata TaxID=34597 RepID=UPI0031394984